MLMRQKVFSILALLLMAVTGAMAQTETLLTTITATGKEQASYSTANVATVSFSYTRGGISVYRATWGWWGNGWTATVNAAEGYTITKCVFYDDADRTATDSEAPFVVETTEEDKTPKVNGKPILADTSIGITKIEVYGYATPTATQYSVTLADGTDDAGNWTISPATAEEGQTVTITYNGTKKVKSVKAVKKGAATIPVTSITLNKTETSIKVGSTETLSVTAVAPDNATDKTYTWKTSDASKATVDQNGKVTAVAAGTVTIYAEANDGSGVKGNCTVTVTSAAPEYYNKLTKINDNFIEQVSLLRLLGRGYQAYNSSLTAAQAYALATYQAAIDGKPVYVIMSSQGGGYEIHYALSTDAAATEHTADLYRISDASNPVRMYYVAQ